MGSTGWEKTLRKPIVMIVSLIVVVLLISFINYKNKYNLTIDESIKNAYINYDEIFYKTNIKNRILVVYGLHDEDVLSVGLLKKNWLGYQWITGSGSSQNDEGNLDATLAISNLSMGNHRHREDYVSVAFGSINSNDIDKLDVEFENNKRNAATILDTSMGRIWFAISDKPIGGDPQIIAINNNGDEIYRNY